MNQQREGKACSEMARGVQAKAGKGFCNCRVGVQLYGRSFKTAWVWSTNILLLSQGLSRDSCSTRFPHAGKTQV